MASQQSKLKTLPNDAKRDTQIAAGLAVTGLLSQQGLQSIAQVLQGAKDAAQALGHVIFMALSKVREKLQQRGMKIDDKVWIAGGGVLDRVLFEVMTAIATILKFKQAADPNFVHDVKETVLGLMHDDDNGPHNQQSDNDEDDQQQAGPPGLGAPQQQGAAPPQQGPSPQGAPQ